MKEKIRVIYSVFDADRKHNDATKADADPEVLMAIRNKKLVELYSEKKDLEVSFSSIGRLNMIIVVHSSLLENLDPANIQINYCDTFSAHRQS